MKNLPDYEKDLASIRQMMERSVKVISLSGLSGILAGLYALIGAAIAYALVHYPLSPMAYRQYSLQEDGKLGVLILLAALVLFFSLGTGFMLSIKKAKKQGIKLWTPASKNLLINMGIPLVSGGLFVLILLYTGHYGIAAPACLIFYGLSLLQGSNHTFDEVRYLAYCEIFLGLVATALPGFGLLFWTLGFGILHILYGIILYRKYDR